MHQGSYFGHGEIIECKKWKAKFKHGGKISSYKVNEDENQKQIYLET